jgi:hypothetical protein
MLKTSTIDTKKNCLLFNFAWEHQHHVSLSFTNDDAMMIIPLLYALVLRSFVGRFALITIAVDRVCDAIFQAGERACKGNNEKSKIPKENIFL